MGLEEGLLPHSRSTVEGTLDEERRYVLRGCHARDDFARYQPLRRQEEVRATDALPSLAVPERIAAGIGGRTRRQRRQTGGAGSGEESVCGLEGSRWVGGGEVIRRLRRLTQIRIFQIGYIPKGCRPVGRKNF